MRAQRTIAGLALIATIVAPMTLTACSTGQDQAQTSSGQAASAHLTVTAFESAVAKPGTTILDVRTQGEFMAGHIAGAENIDVEASDFDERIGALDKSGRYAVYCRSGHRSGIALEKMRAAGFTDVQDLSGGINAWLAAGRPVAG